MKETWKKVSGYEDIYEVSNLGRVRSLDRIVNSGIRHNPKITMKGKNLNIIQDKPNDYKYVKLCRNNKITKKYVHRLVAEAFIPNPNNYPVVNHKDANKENNNINNLEWCTVKENAIHAVKHDLLRVKSGKEHYLAKTVNQYDLDGNFIKKWNTITDASKKLNIVEGQISGCCKKKYGYKTAGGYKWEYEK